ncbi:HEAT repeat domain-containing protein [Actinomadura monticuli]|uniref:HEAT repeat domain-containing protein n=1 Tax=Actinomadura monticuli TaxID=3097367 RepID=A0ABV4QIE2_9ACTN
MALRESGDIDLARLERACGTAGPLLDVVRELAVQADRAENPRNADDAFFLPRSLYAEAIPALPFLVELAGSGEEDVRVDALNLLARLSREANDHEDPEWDPALRGVLPDLAVLLAAPEAEVRLASTRALASAVGDPDLAVSALCEAWDEDDDEAVRLCAVLAVADLAGLCSAAVLPEALIWLRERAAHGSPHARMAASISLARLVEADRADPDAVIRALSEPDVEVWRYIPDLEPPYVIPSYGGTSRQLVHWVDERLAEDLVTRTRLCAVLAHHRDPDRRSEAIKVAAALAAGWRSASAELLPVLAERAADEAVEDRLHALHVIAAMGPDAAAHTELLAAALDDDRRLHSSTDDRIADVAAWGLAWHGDPRCLPRLVERLGAEGLVYGPGDLGGSAGTWYPARLPGAADVLAPLRDHAAALLPVIRDRLADVPETPPQAHMRARPSRAEACLVRLVGLWEEEGAPAVPELTGLLGSRLAVPAVEALAAMGPAAGDALPVIEEAMRRTARSGRPIDEFRDLAFARAHWKITGDPARLAGLVSALAGPRGLPDRILPYIAELGPHAAACEGWVRSFLDSNRERVRYKAAYAMGRITGRPSTWAGMLARVLDHIAEGVHHPASWEAVRDLAALGTAPNGHRRELRTILEADRRHRCSGGWRSFSEDREMRGLAAALLASTEY